MAIKVGSRVRILPMNLDSENAWPDEVVGKEGTVVQTWGSVPFLLYVELDEESERIEREDANDGFETWIFNPEDLEELVDHPNG